MKARAASRLPRSALKRSSTRLTFLWTVEIIQAGIVERKYTFPNAFVVNYTEDFGNTEGVGTFHLNVKQKKDKLANIAIEGGYPAA